MVLLRNAWIPPRVSGRAQIVKLGSFFTESKSIWKGIRKTVCLVPVVDSFRAPPLTPVLPFLSEFFSRGLCLAKLISRNIHTGEDILHIIQYNHIPKGKLQFNLIFSSRTLAKCMLQVFIFKFSSSIRISYHTTIGWLHLCSHSSPYTPYHVYDECSTT